jgi:zinc/manganese transport system substrate-binding protein
MKAEKVKRVFFENMASPKLITQLAKDAGAGVGDPVYSDALSPTDGPAATYTAMLRHNVKLFKEAMLLNGK